MQSDLVPALRKDADLYRRIGEDARADRFDATADEIERLRALTNDTGVVICPVCKDADNAPYCHVCSGCGHLTEQEAATWLRAIASAKALTNDAPVEKLVRKAVDAALSELPKERWSCSDDASGTALTLARQRKWSADAIRAALASPSGEPAVGEDYNGNKPNMYIPPLPKGMKLLAVDCVIGAFAYINHAGTWQGMPNPLAKPTPTAPVDDTRPASGLRQARAICERARDESKHADHTSEDYRRGFSNGAGACVHMLRHAIDDAERAALTAAPTEADISHAIENALNGGSDAE